jgi:D-alanyl-D-alanine dipeptidase
MKTGEEVPMRDKKDDPANFFIDYYKDRDDSQSKKYQRLQGLLVDTMLGLGFRLGSKKEFWHFELPE